MKREWWSDEKPVKFCSEWIELNFYREKHILQITRKKVGEGGLKQKSVTIHRKGIPPEAKALLEEFLALEYREYPAPQQAPPGWSRGDSDDAA